MYVKTNQPSGYNQSLNFEKVHIYPPLWDSSVSKDILNSKHFLDLQFSCKRKMLLLFMTEAFWTNIYSILFHSYKLCIWFCSSWWPGNDNVNIFFPCNNNVNCILLTEFQQMHKYDLLSPFKYEQLKLQLLPFENSVSPKLSSLIFSCSNSIKFH